MPRSGKDGEPTLTLIRIQQHSFQLSDPYQEGHRLTAAEAAALNTLRAENIRNNMSKVLRGLGSKALQGKALQDFTQRVELYDQQYKFFTRTEKKNLDQLEKKVQEVAKERAREEAIKRGLPPLDGIFLIDELAQRDDVRQEALHRLEVEQRVAQEAFA